MTTHCEWFSYFNHHPIFTYEGYFETSLRDSCCPDEEADNLITNLYMFNTLSHDSNLLFYFYIVNFTTAFKFSQFQFILPVCFEENIAIFAIDFGLFMLWKSMYYLI